MLSLADAMSFNKNHLVSFVSENGSAVFHSEGYESQCVVSPGKRVTMDFKVDLIGHSTTHDQFNYLTIQKTILELYPGLADFGLTESKPVSNTQWLVMADWLQEQGAEPLAIFIRNVIAKCYYIPTGALNLP